MVFLYRNSQWKLAGMCRSQRPLECRYQYSLWANYSYRTANRFGEAPNRFHSGNWCLPYWSRAGRLRGSDGSVKNGIFLFNPRRRAWATKPTDIYRLSNCNLNVWAEYLAKNCLPCRWMRNTIAVQLTICADFLKGWQFIVRLWIILHRSGVGFYVG